jgi:3-oxoacyl-[acyl-carrier protein] reductase
MLTEKPARKVALVTGGSGGLGGALARCFFGEGYAVVIHYFKGKTKAEDLCSEITGAEGKAIALSADLRKPEEAFRLVELTRQAFGKIDLLINAAGMIRDRLLIGTSEEDWEAVIQTNLSGPFYMIRAVAPLMRDQGGGQIINIGSLSARVGRSGQASYAASKAGLVALTQNSARELAPHNIRANVVFPGLLSTGVFQFLPGPHRQRLIRENILGRCNTLEEIGRFVLHLASMLNVSGQTFNLDSRIAP